MLASGHCADDLRDCVMVYLQFPQEANLAILKRGKNIQDSHFLDKSEIFIWEGSGTLLMAIG